MKKDGVGSGRRPQCVFLFHRARCANSRRPRDSVSPRRSLLRRRRRRHRVPFHKKISDLVETSALRPTAALLLLAARRVRSRSPFYLYIYYVSSLLVYYHYWHYYCIVVGTHIYNIITITIIIITDYSWIYFFFLFFIPSRWRSNGVSLCARKSRIYSEFRWRTSTTFIPHLATTTTINSFRTYWCYLTPISVRDDNARPRSAISTRFSSPELKTETIGSILYNCYTYHPAQHQQ